MVGVLLLGRSHSWYLMYVTRSHSQYVKCVIWNHIVVWLLESNSNMWRIADGEVTIQNNASLLSIISNGNVTFLETPQLIN